MTASASRPFVWWKFITWMGASIGSSLHNDDFSRQRIGQRVGHNRCEGIDQSVRPLGAMEVQHVVSLPHEVDRSPEGKRQRPKLLR